MLRQRFNAIALATVFVAGVLLAGCQQGVVRTSALGQIADTEQGQVLLGPVAMVVDRHDAYVEADTTLSESEATKALQQSDFVESTVAAAILQGKDELRARLIDDELEAVTLRHDDYVVADDDLSELQRRVHLRTSLLLRKVFDEATSGLPE